MEWNEIVEVMIEKREKQNNKQKRKWIWIGHPTSRNSIQVAETGNEPDKLCSLYYIVLRALLSIITTSDTGAH